MTDIADFLRARYQEDAAAVRANWNRNGITSERYHGTPIDPARLLEDIDTKLAIVDEHHSVELPGEMLDACSTCEVTGSYPEYPCRTLRLLAQPFAGHPDHKGEEWAP